MGMEVVLNGVQGGCQGKDRRSGRDRVSDPLLNLKPTKQNAGSLTMTYSYTMKQIEQIPHNASAWNYLRGLHTHFTIPFSQTFPQVEAYTSTTETRAAPVPFAIEWESDALAQTGSEEEAKRAAGLLLDLADKWDVMRRT